MKSKKMLKNMLKYKENLVVYEFKPTIQRQNSNYTRRVIEHYLTNYVIKRRIK